jgi:metal-responsive CopG/Arc/MetJ family transcriptional regulator
LINTVVAEKRKVSKSRLVREAIAANLQEQKNQDRLSAYDIMKGACGIIKSGRRDLATNPKHMNGFGQGRQVIKSVMPD